MSQQLKIIVHQEIFAICRLEANAAVPAWAGGARFLSITRTADELSVVCEERMVPDEVRAERKRRLMQIEGKLAFAMTGVLSSLATPLAEAGISIFAVATYDTDYLLVRDEDLQEATKALEAAGHRVRQNG